MSTKPGELSRQLNERSKFREIKKGTRRKFKGSTFTWNGKRWIESAGAWKDLGRGIKNKLKIQKDKRTKTLIGKGTAKNPQFKTNRRGTKVSNPSYTPPTKTTKTTTKVTPKVKTKVTPKVKTKVTPKVETKPNKVVKKDKPKTLRSGVFTKDPKTGKTLGVMTRNKRAAWDKKNQAYLQEQLKKNNFRDYGKHGKRYG
tara:strand:- start:2017 stop:2613 length:597 start_codon:yes stop_codon:yes gene_type:complete